MVFFYLDDIFSNGTKCCFIFEQAKNIRIQKLKDIFYKHQWCFAFFDFLFPDLQMFVDEELDKQATIY